VLVNLRINITSDDALVRFLSLPENAPDVEDFLQQLASEGEAIRSAMERHTREKR
jgi:hypothetical protein